MLNYFEILLHFLLFVSLLFYANFIFLKFHILTKIFGVLFLFFYFNRFCRGRIGQQEILLYLFLYFFSDFLQRWRSFHSKQFSSFNFKMFKNVLIASGIAFSYLFLGNVLKIFSVFHFIMKCMCFSLLFQSHSSIIFKIILQRWN